MKTEFSGSIVKTDRCYWWEPIREMTFLIQPSDEDAFWFWTLSMKQLEGTTRTFLFLMLVVRLEKASPGYPKAHESSVYLLIDAGQLDGWTATTSPGMFQSFSFLDADENVSPFQKWPVHRRPFPGVTATVLTPHGPRWHSESGTECWELGQENYLV